MDIQHVRHENFKEILATFKNQNEFANKIGKSGGTITRVKKGGDINDKLARHIETALGLMPGHLDQDESGTLKMINLPLKTLNFTPAQLADSPEVVKSYPFANQLMAVRANTSALEPFIQFGWYIFISKTEKATGGDLTLFLTHDHNFKEKLVNVARFVREVDHGIEVLMLTGKQAGKVVKTKPDSLMKIVALSSSVVRDYLTYDESITTPDVVHEPKPPFDINQC